MLVDFALTLVFVLHQIALALLLWGFCFVVLDFHLVVDHLVDDWLVDCQFRVLRGYFCFDPHYFQCFWCRLDWSPALPVVELVVVGLRPVGCRFRPML